MFTKISLYRKIITLSLNRCYHMFHVIMGPIFRKNIWDFTFCAFFFNTIGKLFTTEHIYSTNTFNQLLSCPIIILKIISQLSLIAQKHHRECSIWQLAAQQSRWAGTHYATLDCLQPLLQLSHVTGTYLAWCLSWSQRESLKVHVPPRSPGVSLTLNMHPFTQHKSLSMRGKSLFIPRVVNLYLYCVYKNRGFMLMKAIPPTERS